MHEVPETTQLDVNLPKPRTRKVLIGTLVAVLALGIVGLAAAIADRAAVVTWDGKKATVRNPIALSAPAMAQRGVASSA